MAYSCCCFDIPQKLTEWTEQRIHIGLVRINFELPVHLIVPFFLLTISGLRTCLQMFQDQTEKKTIKFKDLTYQNTKVEFTHLC